MHPLPYLFITMSIVENAIHTTQQMTASSTLSSFLTIEPDPGPIATVDNDEEEDVEEFTMTGGSVDGVCRRSNTEDGDETTWVINQLIIR